MVRLAGSRSEQAHVVIGGQRRLLDLVEAPCAAGGTIGFARDCTDVEAVRAELWRHINAHADVLESIYAAVAIFGADRKLTFFNHAFASLWGIEEAWLAGEPSLGEILERLRESRRLPEFADFRAFKRERCALFTSLIEPRHELMHLPDGRTLQLTVSPHPFGGLTFVYEDVSDRLALECSYNTLIQVQRATLDHLFEGIAVYGSDGRLKLNNPAFRAMWGLSEEDVAGEPHISEIVEKTRDFIDDRGDWAAVKGQIVAKVIAPGLTSGLLNRRDGSMLQVASVPLPDGEVLLTYLDVSDTARVERALRERNEALETAGRLKSEFIASVSHELRTPLNTVIGFAEILNNQYFGSLNSSQSEYCRGILDSSHQLMTLINDILDLATIEAGYMVLERSRVDIHGNAAAVVTLTQERARSRGLEISLRCPSQIGAIEADERRLKQALFNLISNAIKFTPPGGAIGVEGRYSQGETAVGRLRHRDRHRSGRSSQSLRKIRLQAGRRLRARPVPGQKPDRVARRKCRNRIGVGPRNPGDLQAPHRPWGRSVLGRRRRGTRAPTRARRHGERGPGVASAPRCNHQSRSCASRNSSPMALVQAPTRPSASLPW